MKRVFYLIAIICVTVLLLTGCILIKPNVEFPDITLKYGEETSLPTEVKAGIKNVTVEYSFAGNNISIENGVLKALVAETTTVVKAKYGSEEAQFKVIILLSDKNNTDNPPVDDGNNDDSNNDVSGDDNTEDIDKGIMIINAPESIYSNYPGKEIKVTFSKPEYASDVIFTTNNSNVVVKDGKISASGIFDGTVSVKVTAKSEHHLTQQFTVNVSTYQGGIKAEDAVLHYEQNIIKNENKGGIIFVGDSYFSGQLKADGKPSFWSDFYEDFAGEKAFLMGISQSQIHDLEIVSERIVYPMEPSEIVVHIGFNDVHHGSLTPEALFNRITALCEEYKNRLPDVKIYFMGVEPKKDGYESGTAYYNSSTVKAPALTAKMKEYAESKDWFTYLETMSVFVDEDGNVKKDSYLSTDLSHPTLAAYDEIREIINTARKGNNTPDNPTDTPDNPTGTPDNPTGTPDNPTGTPDTPTDTPDNPPSTPDEPIDYGTLSLEAPNSIYANYPSREIKALFSKPDYAENIVYTTDNANVLVENGKIYAKGNFSESGVDVTVTATTEHFGTKTFVVKVSTYNGGVSAESKVQYYEKNIIKDENKGGTIFVGDSYFDGAPNATGTPPFWADFYYDYQNEEKIFLMGISGSQINNLEIVSERIVYPMEPKEIIIHIGFNDVHHGNLTPDQLYSRITALCEQYREKLPEVKIYYIGVEPKKNAYESDTSYYYSSTVKAPALTAKMKEYAESKDWFTYVDTLSIFTDGQTIISDSYLHADLSHPSLHAYDEIRKAINTARGVENYVPDDVVYVNDHSIGATIDSTGKEYRDKNNSPLTDNYIISGKLTIADISVSNAHLQFRFSKNYRFLLWDSNSDFKIGVGYQTASDSKNDQTPGAAIFDAESVRLTLDWAVVLNQGTAYLFINGTLMEKMNSPVCELFRIGASQMDVQFYGINLTVKSDSETAYNSLLETYDLDSDVGGLITSKTLDMATSNEKSFILPYSDAKVIENSVYIKYNNSELTKDYIISGKLNVTQLGDNAHLQLRFNENYRFLIWDSNSDKTYGIGWEEDGGHVSETASGSLNFAFATASNTLEWTVVMTENKAHFFVNGTLVKSFNSFTMPPEQLNIGAEKFGAEVYDLELTLKSVNNSEYAAKLSALGITY